jgi:hypothetical protein
MSRIVGALKFIACLLAGAVIGAAICVLAEVCFLGVRSTAYLFGVTAGSKLIAGVAGAVAAVILRLRPMRRRQKVLFVVAMALWSPFIGLFGEVLVYEPIKFSLLIHRVESATTPAEERASFMLAKRWGCCWEVHLEEPPKKWLDPKELDAVVRDPTRRLAVELEWLESKPSGAPYRARRTLTEKTNIYILLALN